MKILFIIASLGSGGAERVLSNLANIISKKHDVTIATFSNSIPFYALDEKVKHIKLDLLKPSQSAFQSFKNSVNRLTVLMRIMRDIHADVNISFMTQTNILAILASKFIRRKIIVAERAVYDFYPSRAIHVLRRATYPFADFLVTQTVEDSQRYHFIKKTEVVYNPIFIEKIERTKEKIVLAVGRLDKNKGFDLLIETFAQLESKGWKLIIAGDGEERESLIELIENLNLNNVELIGKRKDIFQWYAKASVFVLPSKKEGFPNVLIEAMASGCAAVSFDCPSGPAEIIMHEKNGLLVEDQNREVLASVLQRVMNDKALRERLAYYAMEVRQKYALEKIALQWEEIIERVVR